MKRKVVPANYQHDGYCQCYIASHTAGMAYNGSDLPLV